MYKTSENLIYYYWVSVSTTAANACLVHPQTLLSQILTFDRNLGLMCIDGLGGGGSITGQPGSRLCTLQSNS